MNDLIVEVQYLRDRQDILDCINRYSRALDRHDRDMMLSVYHEDGIDEHGDPQVNTPGDFFDWVNKVHEDNWTMHHHHVTVHNCDLQGDTAHCESYVIVSLSTKTEPQKVWITSGRYIDRLEKRKGQWKIAYRTSVLEWSFEADGSLFTNPAYSAYGFPMGTHDRSDRSYQRPLRLEAKKAAAFEKRTGIKVR
jgi:ketosteroid isomerase-like protein